MKRLLYIIFTFMAAVIMNSCTPVQEETFNETLLSGYWVTTSQVTQTPDSEYWYYAGDETGYTWDSSEDISESEAQDFTWELAGSRLSLIHLDYYGNPLVPKSYTIKTLTETTLIYYDELSEKSRTFTKTTQPL